MDIDKSIGSRLLVKSMKQNIVALLRRQSDFGTRLANSNITEQIFTKKVFIDHYVYLNNWLFCYIS